MSEQAGGSVGIEREAVGEYRLASPAATSELGRCFARVLEPGDIVVLSGDLGAGKTCFTGGVAAGLGDGRPVTSPTFTIMVVHDGGRIPLYHFDLYRLDDPEQLDDVGFYDALEGDGACLIEWGERFAAQIGDERLDLAFTREDAAGQTGEPARLVRGQAHGARARDLLAAFDREVERAASRQG